MPREFLFGQPNSIQYTSRRFLTLGCGLCICGLVCVLMGAIASALEAEKTYHVQHFVNTHWITTVFLFCGVSVLLMEKFKLNFYLFLCTTFAIVTIPVSFGAFVGDCVNLAALRGVNERLIGTGWTYLNHVQFVTMQVYAGVDLVCCVFALVLAVLTLLEIRKLSSRYFAPAPEYKSIVLTLSGVLLTGVSLCKLVLWSMEVAWVRELGDSARFLFLHYTIDEPVWQAVYITCGLLNVFVAFRGTRILMYCSLGLTTLSTYPSILYFWIDYRWYSNVRMTDMTAQIPRKDHILEPNLAVGGVHLLVILFTVCTQLFLIHKAGNPIYEFKLKTEASLRTAVSMGGLLLIGSGIAFLISDIATLITKTFYRIFYPTEQKLPFVLCCAGVVVTLCLRKQMSLYFIPVAFVFLLQAAHTSVFHIAAYLYLGQNTYFHDSICELFFWGKKVCSHGVEQLGAVSHFFEALMAVCVLMLIFYLGMILLRLMSLHHLQMGALGFEEIRRKKQCERWLLGIGIFSSVLGFIVFSLSLFSRNISGFYNDHPLLILHSVIYRSCLSLALILYPAVQIYFSHNITYYPLRSMALCFMCLFRFVEVLTQLDYRNVGQDPGVAWTMFSLVELLSLALNFASLCLCANLLDLGLNRLPNFDFEQTSTYNDSEHTANPRLAELKSLEVEVTENGFSNFV